jgi:hypothetical protein
MSRFPILDYDRNLCEFASNGREVLHESAIEPSVAETDEWVTLPIRSIVDNNNGAGFEIGPYSLTNSDVVALHNALVDHMNNFPSDFRHIGGVA